MLLSLHSFCCIKLFILLCLKFKFFLRANAQFLFLNSTPNSLRRCVCVGKSFPFTPYEYEETSNGKHTINQLFQAHCLLHEHNTPETKNRAPKHTTKQKTNEKLSNNHLRKDKFCNEKLANKQRTSGHNKIISMCVSKSISR